MACCSGVCDVAEGEGAAVRGADRGARPEEGEEFGPVERESSNS